jgi:hypothetical protein
MKRGVIVSSLVLLLVIVGVVLWRYGSRDSSRARNRCDDYAYIPDGIFTKQMDSPATLWEYYSAMQEAPFSCLDSRTEAYRFLFIPSLDSPASIRVWRDGNHSFVAIKQLTQTGIPKYGGKDLKVNETRPLDDEQWNHFKELLAKTSFWSMRAEDDTPIGLDGAMFVLEGHERNNYHVIVRWSDKDEALMNVTGYFFDLARLQWRR